MQTEYSAATEPGLIGTIELGPENGFELVMGVTKRDAALSPAQWSRGCRIAKPIAIDTR